VCTGMGVFGKKSMPAGTTAEDADFASKAASMREAQDAQQLKTFTRWWNSVLKPRGVKIEDLVVEVSPGVNPIMLYEELSGTLVKKYSKKPPSRFQKLENQNIFLKSLKEKGIRLVNIGAEDLVDSNRTLICGLTWTLILRYEIQKYGANESELLRWVKACTAGYKGVNITTWGDSFNDGLAFCALLHKHDENVLNYDKNSDPKKALGNLDTAFTAAEKRWDVPRLLEPEELAGPDPTDEKSVITYVAKLRQAFLDREAEMMRKLKEEEEARKKAEREARQAALKKMVQDLKTGVDDWNKWTKSKEGEFRKKEGEAPSYPEERCEKELEGLKKFRTEKGKDDKPPKAEEKARLADLYNKVRGEVMVDAMDAAKEGYQPVFDEGEIADCAPEVLGGKWKDMEKAERDFEDALGRRLADLDAAKRAKETDDLLKGLKDKADELMDWLKGKKGDMDGDARSIGDEDDIAKKQAKLDELLSDEKPPKLDETGELAKELHAVADRLAAEGRDPPPDLEGKLQGGWNAFDDAAAALQKALDDARKKAARDKAMAETDKLQKENEDDANKWLDKVNDKAKDFEDKVKSGDLGNTKEEAEKKLADLRSPFQSDTKPEWGKERGGIDAGRRAVDDRRKDEDRPPADWKPPGDDLDKGWKRLGDAEREYEKALLDKLGKLDAEEQERLKKAARKEKALADIADELPPLVQRRKVEKDAAAAAAEAAQKAADIADWAQKETAALQEQLAALEGDKVSPAEPPLAALEKFCNGDKTAKQGDLLDARAAACDAIATRQLQRAGAGGPADAAIAESLPKAEEAWAAMEEAERRLKHALQDKIKRAQGANLEWERLKRGCTRVAEWLAASTPERMRSELGGTEAEVTALLEEARAVSAALGLQIASVAILTPLAERLFKDEEYAERAKAAIGTVDMLPSLAAPMAERVARLEEELERQRRLMAERREFSEATGALEASIVEAEELVGFPVDTVDTAEIIAALREVGDKQESDLLPAPEAAEPDAIKRAEAACATWRQLSSMMPPRAAACEAAHRAALAAEKLQCDYREAAEAFRKWHAGAVALLTMPAGDDARAADDVRKAAEIAIEQLPVGEAHHRAAKVASDRMASYSIAQNPSVLTLAQMSAALTQMRSLLSLLQGAAKLAPGNATLPTKKIVAALEDLAEATGVSPASLGSEFGLPDEHVKFLEDEMEKKNGALQPTSFDPFPADRSAVPTLSLPTIPLDLRAHGLAVIEHVNKARKEPENHADTLEAALSDAYEGNHLTCPPSWGGKKLVTAEGVGALRDLLKALRKATGNLPTLRLVAALDDAAQQAAEELAAGKQPTDLTTRLSSRGTFSGSAGEAIVYGVRQPEPIAAQLLLSDGDAQRRNRSFLMNGDLKVAGFGLADHPQHGSVCVIVCTSLFATPIDKPMTVECQGEANDDFQRVLDAIPSEQARDIATDALVVGKKVKLDYVPGSIDITVYERDGSARTSSLKWA